MFDDPANINMRLEEEEGFVVCDHTRDFIPGRSVIGNIEHPMLSSRRMICLLSE